jgi:Protein of unknown function (DUF3667)
MIKKKLRKTEHCLNCGEQIQDHNYCPHCGQLNTNKHVSVSHFFRDFAGEFFTFDSKFFKSFGPLLLQPGHLTNEYSMGRRVRYILPLRLYIFVTFLFFFMLSVNSSLINVDSDDISETSSKKVIEKISEKNEIVFSQEQKEKLIKGLDDDYSLQKKLGKLKSIDNESGKEKSWWSLYLETKIQKVLDRGGGAIRELTKEVINHLPKMMFILLPLFALLLKLLYIRQKVLYVKHLVFALHIHTFIFIVYSIFVFLPEWYIITLGLLGIYIYFFRALRIVYGQSKWMTFFKLNTIFILYLVLLPFAAIFLALMTLISI